MEKLLNLIFIPECIFCKKIGSFFCNECLNKCTKLDQLVLFKETGVKSLFAYEYEGLIRECIRSAKYKNKHFAALKILSKKVFLLFETKLSTYVKDNSCVIIPIPVSRAKLHKRGFNQAELIAQIFSRSLKIPTKPDLLKRVKETSSQYTNNRKERFKNMRGAFEVSSATGVKDKKVLLIDDVCTTGATLIEASTVLKNAGAKDVVCIALARKSLVKPTYSHSGQV